MKNRILLLLMLLMPIVLTAGNFHLDRTETLIVVIGDSTTVDTNKILNLRHYGNHVVGRIIIEPSEYTTGGYGILDTAEIIVKAVFRDKNENLIESRTLDSVKQTGVNALPCTLIINTFDDSTLDLTRLEIYTQVRDTVDVVAQATYNLQIDFIHTWSD